LSTYILGKYPPLFDLHLSRTFLTLFTNHSGSKTRGRCSEDKPNKLGNEPPSKDGCNCKDQDPLYSPLPHTICVLSLLSPPRYSRRVNNVVHTYFTTPTVSALSFPVVLLFSPTGKTGMLNCAKCYEKCWLSGQNTQAQARGETNDSALLLFLYSVVGAPIITESSVSLV